MPQIQRRRTATKPPRLKAQRRCESNYCIWPEERRPKWRPAPSTYQVTGKRHTLSRSNHGNWKYRSWLLAIVVVRKRAQKARGISISRAICNDREISASAHTSGEKSMAFRISASVNVHWSVGTAQMVYIAWIHFLEKCFWDILKFNHTKGAAPGRTGVDYRPTKLATTVWVHLPQSFCFKLGKFFNYSSNLRSLVDTYFSS